MDATYDDAAPSANDPESPPTRSADNGVCPTVLIDDEPASEDELFPSDQVGPHTRVASAMADLIRSNEKGGKVIGVEGGWGAGKTTVIRLFRAQLSKEPNERKYPAKELAWLRKKFARPATIHATDIEAALIWKYGHSGKASYPERQRRLAARISDAWPSCRISPGCDPSTALQVWHTHVGRTSFVTFCFLLHLANPTTFPILDQHNLRSVNHHLGLTGSLAKAAPRTLADLDLVRRFEEWVMERWSPVIGAPAPTPDELDRYLMMHGRSLKAATRH